MSSRSRLVRAPVEPDGHLWLRVGDPSWEDPFDGGWAAVAGGRWNPPGSWPTLYLNRDLRTARAQVDRLLAGSPVRPDDLTDDAFELAAARLPDGQLALDAETDRGVRAAGLPPTYPLDGSGAPVDHTPCQALGRRAHDAGLDGVVCRSAATPDGSGRELAWWPEGRSIRRVGGRVPYGDWRTPSLDDPTALFRRGRSSSR